MNHPVGKCGECGGVVSEPSPWMGMNRPPAICEKCGAVADTPINLPTLPMKPKQVREWTWNAPPKVTEL